MQQNVQSLLLKLAQDTVINDSSISAEAKNILAVMRKEIKSLQASNDPDKQAKMIAVLLGGIIYTLVQDDCKYHYADMLYPVNGWEPLDEIKDIPVNPRDSNIGITRRIYAIGQGALERLPNSFNIELLQRKAKLINTKEPQEVFPKLVNDSDSVELLVKFCMKYKDNLNQPSFDLNELKEYEYGYTTVITEEATTAPVETSNAFTMQLLGGFITALGVAAVATAFIALNAATFGIPGLVVAAVGVAAILTGVGLFAAGTHKSRQNRDDNQQYSYLPEAYATV